MKAMIPGSEFELRKAQAAATRAVIPVAVTRAVILEAIPEAAVGEVLPTLGRRWRTLRRTTKYRTGH
jgi:hypothetical protein